MVFAFVVYSFVNIINSSVLIPAKMAKSMVGSYVLLIVGTIASFFALKNFIPMLSSASWAMTIGSSVCLFFMVYWIKKKMGFSVFNLNHIVVILLSLGISFFCILEPTSTKLIAFIPVFVFLTWILFKFNFLGKDDIFSVRDKLLSLVGKKS